MSRIATDPKPQLTKLCAKNKMRIIRCPKNMSRELGKFECQCGHEFEATANYVLTHAACQICTKEQWREKLRHHSMGKSPGNKKSHADFVRELKARNPNLRCQSTYESALKHVKIRCRACKTTCERLPINALRFGCPGCSGLLPKTVDSYNEELRAKEIHFQATEYLGARTSVTHTCTLCKRFTLMAPPTNALRIGKLTCPICDSGTVWVYEIPGRVFRIRGYERFALPKLLKLYGEDDLFEDLSGRVPRITYNGKTHKPDFYVPSKNLLIEIKSLETLGMSNLGYYKNPAESFRQMVQKRQAAVAAGYRYQLILVSSKGTPIRLPKDWHRHTRRELMAHISSLGIKLRAST